MHKILSIAALILGAGVFAGDIFVDYQSGKSGNPGTKDAPLPDVRRAVAKAKPGDTIYVLPSEQPIRDNIQVTNLQGTPEKPITIDGMNNIFLGTLPLKSAEWEEVSPGLFRKKMVTGKNWTSRFFLTFNGHINRMGHLQKAGNPGAKYKAPETLAPGEWTVVQGDPILPAKGPHPQFNFEFYVRLPEGKTALADSGVEEPNIRKNGGVNVRGKCRNLIFRNIIVKNFFNDGYNIHGDCEAIHFENIAAVECGDDGISAHESCKLSGKNMVFIGCSTAICHIAEVTSIQENVYAEKISGRELFFLANSNNTVKNVYMIADSFSGSLWTNRKKDEHQVAVLENVCVVSNNPEAIFEVKSVGEVALTASNVQLAGFKRIMKKDGVTGGNMEKLRETIAAKRVELFAIFGGNLEKALQ